MARVYACEHQKRSKLVTLISLTWVPKKYKNRNFTGANAAANSSKVDEMLEYLSQYTSNALYRDIAKKATSLEAVWTLVRNWAGLKTSGCKQQSYFKVKHSFVHSEENFLTDFFFALRDAKEDCLLISGANGGKITFHGDLPAEDEELTPILESYVVGLVGSFRRKEINEAHLSRIF